MKKSILFITLLLFCFVNSFSISKETFYKAFSSVDLQLIDESIATLTSDKQTSLSKAYKGSLLMKRAALVSNVKEKISSFKSGATLLENEIKNKPKSVEYRLLRLAIQEKAPKVLGYNKNMEEDKKVLIKSFSGLDKFLQIQIMDYVKKSSLLTVSDFK